MMAPRRKTIMRGCRMQSDLQMTENLPVCGATCCGQRFAPKPGGFFLTLLTLKPTAAITKKAQRIPISNQRDENHAVAVFCGDHPRDCSLRRPMRVPEISLTDGLQTQMMKRRNRFFMSKEGNCLGFASARPHDPRIDKLPGGCRMKHNVRRFLHVERNCAQACARFANSSNSNLNEKGGCLSARFHSGCADALRPNGK